MSRAFRVAALLGAAAVLYVACGTEGTPDVSVTAKPRTIDNRGQTAVLTVTATDAQGKSGTGTVRVTSAAGSLKDSTDLTLGADGTATVDFSCDARVDATCTGSIVITAEWVVKGKLYSGTVNVSIAQFDAGPPDAGPPDAGPPDAGPDAGLTLTASRARIFMGVGDSSDLTATLRLNGVPAPGEQLNLSTTLGLLSLPDGGSVGQTLSAPTDSAGAATVHFTENGDAGIATITAVHATTGARASASVEVVAVTSIAWTATLCGTPAAACSIMGVQGSGYNETAIFRFALKDAANRPVQGVSVTFTLQSSASGATVVASATSDAMGNADATVRSGPGTGTVSVKATVIPVAVETTSPTIGVRGAKPSNQGFSLQCQKVNLAAYRSATPPLPITVSCTVALVDRSGNPVGTGAPVFFKSEAGRVPGQLNTTAFATSGANPDEGKVTFSFDTSTTFPAQDVAPLAADATQYPYARDPEPQYASGPLTMNPRDGLVTVIAYVAGEEHYWDTNSNGVHDPGERFIDQGEPLVDANDNDVWDPGELYVDADLNGAWTPPNGTWDSNAMIWTKFLLLYTDASAPAAVVAAGQTPFVPNGYNVAKGTSSFLNVFMPDVNLNHIESGATVAVRHTATKGAVTLVGLNTGLDGYGFQVEAQRLLNATGTGACAPAEPRCIFKTIFGTWGLGYVGQVRIDGAALTDTTLPQADTATVETTVRGVVVGASVNGTIQ